MLPWNCNFLAAAQKMGQHKGPSFKATSISCNGAVLCQEHAAYTTWQGFFQGMNCGGHWLLRPLRILLCMRSGGWQSLEQPQRSSHLFTDLLPSPSSLTRRLKSDALYWLRLSFEYFLSVAVAFTLFKHSAVFCQSRSIFIPVFRLEFSCLLRFSVLVFWQTAQYKHV